MEISRRDAYGRDERYGARRAGWGCNSMKVLHRLVKNGNSVQVSMPQKMLRHLEWRAGTVIIVELTACGTIEIRKPTMADLHSATMPQSFELAG